MAKAEYIQALLRLGINCQTQRFIFGGGGTDVVFRDGIDVGHILELDLLPNIYGQQTTQQIEKRMELAATATCGNRQYINYCRKHEKVFAQIKNFHIQKDLMVRMMHLCEMCGTFVYFFRCPFFFFKGGK